MEDPGGPEHHDGVLPHPGHLLQGRGVGGHPKEEGGTQEEHDGPAAAPPGKEGKAEGAEEAGERAAARCIITGLWQDVLHPH